VSLKNNAELPEKFGFVFRYPVDTIWGLWSADTDERTEKIWSDVNQLLEEYGFSFDIVYSTSEFNDDLKIITINYFSGTKQ
jgi:hypothetical protein